MDGERLLKCVLQGDASVFHNIQNYVSPLCKLLDSVNTDGRKAVECDRVVAKYGVFCMKLLRYCIEAIQKKEGIEPEECFQYAKLGADMLSRLLTSGIHLPSNVTITGIVKLLFHLIISALKQHKYIYLVHFSDCLLHITDGGNKVRDGNISKDVTTKPTLDNLTKDVTSICKQVSDHLWNAAIKLEQSKLLEKHERAVLALTIRKNSLFLLSVAKPDLGTIVERGLKAARQHQLSSTNGHTDDELQAFLFDLFIRSVETMNTSMALKNDSMQEGAYNYLEDLCINCYKCALTAEPIEKLQGILSRSMKDTKNASSRGRSGVFQTVLAVLHCSLGLRARLVKLENRKSRDDLKWTSAKRELVNIAESVKNLDGNLCKSSHLVQTMDCLRSCCNKLFNKIADDTNCHEKMPQEVLSSMLNLFLVCFEKSRSLVSQQTSASSWKQNILPSLTMLYFISSVILKNAKNGLEKFLQNGRKMSFKSDYVAAMLAGKTLLDELTAVSAAAEHYRYLATDAFNVGLVFFKNSYVTDATSLARLSCNAASAWSETETGTKNLHEALLFKKYELLSDCLDKQCKWNESLCSMTRCCQLYAVSMVDFYESGASDRKALDYLEKWSIRKHHVTKQFSKEKDMLQVKRSTLYDGWEQLDKAGQSSERDVCTLLKMELESYRKRSYCTDDEELAVIEKLFDIFTNNGDSLNVCLMKLEEVKVMYRIQGCVDNSHFVATCKDIIQDLNELVDQDSVLVQDILASSYFWCFILQYSMTVNQSRKYNVYNVANNDGDDLGENLVKDKDDEVINLNLVPDFLVFLQRASSIWTKMAENIQDLDVVSRHKMCWNLQIASSVYAFLNMPLARVHTLNVLAAVAQTCGGCEDMQTVIVARSTAIYVLCEQGNISLAEVSVSQCEEVLLGLGNDCRPANKCIFLVAKSYVLLLKGLYDEGWQLLNEILGEFKTSTRAVSQLVLLKAKLLGWKYLSLPPSTWNSPTGGCTHLEFLLDSLKRAEALVEYLANGDIDEMAHVVLRNQHKEQYGLLLSHWSVLNELSSCLMETSKVYLLQGAVREAKSYLDYGRNIATIFYSPIRLSQFTIRLAELNVLKCDMEDCEKCIKKVLEMLKPGALLFDILKMSQPFDPPSESFSVYEYDYGSLDKLQLQFLLCFCEYLRRMERSADAGTVILLLRGLRSKSISRYQMSLKSLDGVMVSSGVKEEQNSSRKAAKTRGKRGKNVSRMNETKTEDSAVRNMDPVASVAFLESGLKIAAVECDMALCDGDYTTLLSRFQEGLELVQTAQRIVKAPVLLDLMSVSLLYYVRGVAHVLSSQAGFDGWRVAGRPCSSSDVSCDAALSCPEDMSDLISRLEISSVILDDDDDDDDEDHDEDQSVESLTEKLRHESWEHVDSVCCPEDEGVPRRGRRYRNQASKEPDSEKPKTKPTRKTTGSAQSCKTSTRKKASKKTPSVVQVDLTATDDQEDPQGEPGDNEEPKSTRKGGRSTRKNRSTIEDSVVKSSTKPRRKGSRLNATTSSTCDVTVVNAEKTVLPENVLSGRKTGKKTSKKSQASRVCQQNNEKPLGSICEKDEDISKALDCLHLSLEYLHPTYNPTLFARICHGLVNCYGLKSSEDAAIYHNLPFATTLRHQALISSAKKIRKIKEELKVDERQGDNPDDWMYTSMVQNDREKTQCHKLMYLRTVQNTIGFNTCIEDLRKRFQDLIHLLPDDLTVCTLSLVSSPESKHCKQLVVTRLRKQEKPLVLKLRLPGEDNDQADVEEDFQAAGGSIVRDLFAASRRNIESDFVTVLEESRESMTLTDKYEWWNRRTEIDERLQRVLQRLENSWFGKWRGILSGHFTEDEDIQMLKSNLEHIQNKALGVFGAAIENEQLLELFIEWYALLKPPEVAEGLAELTGMKKNSPKVTKFCKMLKEFFTSSGDSQATASAPRGPVVLILDKAIQHLPFESMPVLRHQEVSRMPSLDFVTSHLRLQAIKTSPVDILTSGVDTQKTFYVLNPRKDLKKTEKMFEEWFTTEEGWTGVVGRPPTGVEVKDALSKNHLYLYLGHGTGREFFKGDEVQRLYCQAVTILMGCSSGKLIVQGDCDARGMVLNYLLSGCPAVVANLWDVTDGDIDRFSSALFKTWLKKDNKLSLSRCVTQCRKVCLLKYLIGSAPVIYGMPVYTKH